MRFTLFTFFILAFFCSFLLVQGQTDADETTERSVGAENSSTSSVTLPAWINTTFSNETAEQTTPSGSINEPSTMGTSPILVESTTNPVQTEPSPTTTIPVATPSTTRPGKVLLYECDFTDPCYAADQLTITDGSEFNADDLSEPPRAPSSDADSINGLTVNNGRCQLPFQPSNDQQNATWDMYFCYKNECPIDSNGTMDTCRSGRYGFVALDSSTSMLTIRDSIVYSTTSLRVAQKRCLRYSYYFTVYAGLDWGQEMDVTAQIDDEFDWERVIDEVSVADMQGNRWHSRSVSFESSLTNFTFAIGFRIISTNQTQDEMENRTIYFALDNIQFFDGSCDDETTTSAPMTTQTQSTTTATEGATNPTDGSKKDLGLILGLSLGLGIPVLLIIILAVFYFTSRGKKTRLSAQRDIPLRSRGARDSTADTRL